MKFASLVLVFLCAWSLHSATAQTTSEEQLAVQYYQDKEYSKAIALFDQLFSKKNNAYYYVYYLQSLLESGDFKKAEKIVKKQIKDFPSDLKYWVDLGFVYISENLPDKAEKTFEEVIKNLSANQQQCVDLANAFVFRRQLEHAISTYQTGRKLMKSPAAFCIELAYIYENTGNYPEMMSELLNFAEQNQVNLPSVQYLLQNSLSNDPEGKKNEVLRTLLLKKIQKNPDLLSMVEMLYWLSIQQKEFDMAFNQARSLDKRLKENGDRIFHLAEICVSNKNYDAASKCYEYLISKGPESIYYLSAHIQLLHTSYLKITSVFPVDIAALKKTETEYLQLLEKEGYNSFTLDLIRDLAHIKVFYINDLQGGIRLLQQALEIPNANPMMLASCKIELADALLFSDEVWDASLLYSQVEKALPNEPIGHQAKFKNACLSYYIGQFDWAKTQLDILKASTSKLISNDAIDLAILISENRDDDSATVGLTYYAHADLLLYRNRDDLALKTLDSIAMLGLAHPLNDEVLFKKAKIMLKNGRYTEADSLLAKLLEFYGDDILGDDALMLQAQIQETYLHDKAKAMALYKQLFTLYHGSLFAAEARKNFRRLRGDEVQ